jgi:3-deoxy-manno-octulosonate cytidylyltransferase (CMP-KDO synthetase)
VTTPVPGGAVLVIPARIASTRLPGKPLLRRTGKYLVQHAWEQARRVASATAVLVATDDAAIAEAVRSFGGEAVMTSPGCATGTDRVAEATRDRPEDLVVNVQGDEPEFDPGDVDRLVAALRADPSLPLATLAVVASEEERDRPSAVKVVLRTGSPRAGSADGTWDGTVGGSGSAASRPTEGDALYFSRSRIPFHRDGPAPDGALTPPVLRHVGIYGFRREALQAFTRLPPTPLEQAEKLEQLRALENGWRIRVLVGERAPAGIDTPEDYEAFVRRETSRSAAPGGGKRVEASASAKRG